MATFDADHIRGVIGNYFGKHAKKSWKALVSDFLYVLYGVKNGFLYDYSITDSNTMIEFVQEFTNMLAVDTLVSHCLVVTVVEGNIFVVNTNLAAPFLLNCLDNLKCIDVSGKLVAPVVCTEDVISVNIRNDLATSLKNILEFKTQGIAEVGQACNENKSSFNIKKLKLDVTSTCNISTLFGILIGYPVLYWYNVGDVDNCLGMVPLRVYTVKCNVCFGDIISDKFAMYSFSVPDSLASCFDGSISAWFEDLQSRAKDLDLFQGLELDSHVVTLPALAL